MTLVVMKMCHVYDTDSIKPLKNNLQQQFLNAGKANTQILLLFTYAYVCTYKTLLVFQFK